MCVLYVPLVGAIYGSPSGDPAHFSGEDRFGVGWIELWEMLFGIPLWLAIGGLLLSAGRSGRMPGWARGWSAILYVAAAIATWGISQVYIAADGGISVIVPALLVPLIVGYATSMRLPVFARLSPDQASRIALIAGAVVIVAAIPLGFYDLHYLPAHLTADARRMEVFYEKRQADEDKARAEEEAHFKALTPDSPLEEWVHYLHSKDDGDPEQAVALAGARSAKSRQADAIRLLDAGGIHRLQELWEFDLQATPGLCAAYDHALQKEATSEDFDTDVGELVKIQLPNIKFFVAGGCDLRASLNASEARVQKIIAANPGDKDWSSLLATLTALHQKG